MLQVAQSESVLEAQTKPRLRGLDLVGVVLSSACLIHCTVLPLVLALLPVCGAHFQLDHRWHVIITALIVPVALLALVSGWWRHRKHKVLVLGGISLLMILGAPFLHELVGHVLEEVVATLGGLVLISAHLINHKTLRQIGSHRCHCHK